jgi:hypothetical protein
MVDWRWDVEQVWHFLAGLCPRFIEPLRDDSGHAIRYRSVLGYERCAPAGMAGSAQAVDEGWHLRCDGGVVRLAR